MDGIYLIGMALFVAVVALAIAARIWFIRARRWAGTKGWIIAAVLLLLLLIVEAPALIWSMEFQEVCEFGDAREGSKLRESDDGLLVTRCVLQEPGEEPVVTYHDGKAAAVGYLAVGNLVLLAIVSPFAAAWTKRHN